MKKRKMREYKEETGNRRSREYLFWRKAILGMGGYECSNCGLFSPTGKSLIAHHLDSYTKNEELQVDIDNGRILCVDCHKDFHSLFSYDKFTREDFFMWIENNKGN